MPVKLFQVRTPTVAITTLLLAACARVVSQAEMANLFDSAKE